MLSIAAMLLALGLSGAPALPQQTAPADAAVRATVGSAKFKDAARGKVDLAKGKITADLALTGDRPSGRTAESSTIAQTAAASVRAFGLTPRFSFSSTDSNIPISLSIPAITLVAGGASDRAYALDEWIDLDKTSSLGGMQIMLATLLTLAGTE